MSRDSRQSGRDRGDGRRDAHDWLPYSFSIVGAQKSGTSTLSTALDRHPQVARAPRKELQFFTREDMDWERPDYSGYRAPRRKPQHLIAGDATPAYLFWPHALERMHRLQPRHAADRGVPRPARAAVLALDDAARPLDDRARLAGVHHRVPPRRRRRRRCPTCRRWRSSSAPGVARGYYGDQLTRGLTIFPREQWLWLEFRAMLADFPGALDQLTDFLGVDRYGRHPEPAG